MPINTFYTGDRAERPLLGLLIGRKSIKMEPFIFTDSEVNTLILSRPNYHDLDKWITPTSNPMFTSHLAN